MAKAGADVLDDIEYQWLDEGAQEDAGSSAEQMQRPSDAPKLISQMTPKEKFRVLKMHTRADMDALATFRTQVSEDFGFLAGDQLSTDDKTLLDAQQRPHIVFNRTQTILSAVAGMQINGRSEIKFLPRTLEDAGRTEVLTGASKWMADGCDAEDEESGAFQTGSAVGVGCCESRFSYDDSREGRYIEEEIDPREMVWDRAAKKKNLVDRRRTTRIRKMPFSDARQMFPGKTRFQIDAAWANTSGDDRSVKSIEEKRIRNGEDSYEEHDDLNEVTVVCTEWFEREPYWVIVDDATASLMEVSEKEYEMLRRRFAQLGMKLEGVRMMRKRYYRAWLGNEYLGGGDAPCGNRFSWEFVTAHYDKKKRIFYGLVRIIRDPQMWANKFMSQIMQIMNATAKGGILAEMSAFEDMEEAEETYASPDQITWMADGALSGAKPKVMPKPGQGDASVYVQLLQFAVSSIKDVTGINLELLGQQDQNQPGVLEYMRKQAGMTVLASLFDNFRRFLKGIGDKRLHFIQTRMSDGRLIRIVGPENAEMVPLAKELTTGEYDTVVDDAPTSPNQKEANWAIIQPMLAAFKEQILGNPQLFVAILRYSPLPSALVSEISKVVLASQNDPQKAQEAEQMKNLTIQHLVAQINKDQSVAEMNNAKAGTSQATAIYDIAMARNMMADNARAEQKHSVDLETANVDRFTALAGMRKAAADVQHIRAKTAREIAGMGSDRAKTALEILRERTKALMESRKHNRDDALVAHQAEMGRHKSMVDRLNAHAGMISAVGGFHRDIAGAHRDRVGAVVDSRPEPRTKQ